MAKERVRDRGLKTKTTKKDNIFGAGSELGALMKQARERMGAHTVSTGISAAGCTYIETGIFLLDLALLGGLQESRVNQIYGWEASSKALALDTPIPTPDGWTTMGQLSVGDKVFSEDGTECSVTFVTDIQLDKKCYEVIFDDGERIVACEDHLWPVVSRYHKTEMAPRILKTSDLAKDVFREYSHGDVRYRWRIELAKPLVCGTKILPIDPYVLGVWLGDGHSASARLTCADEGILDNLRSLGVNCLPRKAGKNRPKTLYQLSSKTNLHTQLRLSNLLNNKHIPDIYLRGDVSQRLALLQGLMDTDGCASVGGTCKFTSVKVGLARSVLELCISLGYKASFVEGRATLHGMDKGPVYCVCFTPNNGIMPFRLHRKCKRIQDAHVTRAMRSMARTIVAVNEVPSVPVKCITVDSKNHLYLAGANMVPTHNTTTAMRAIAAAQRKHPDQAVAFIDAEGTFDPVWAGKHGVDCERLVYFQPETGEECVDVLEAAIRAKETCAVVLDSVPAIVPQKIIENSAEDMTVGKRAQLMGIACSKMIAALQAERGREHNPSIIVINQWRTKIGVMHGDPRRLPGGDQLKFLSSVMLEMKRGKVEMGKDEFENDTPVLNTHAFDLDKLKGGASITQGEFKMIRCANYQAKEGGYTLPAGAIDDYKTVATYAKRMGFITGGGASWRIDGVGSKFSKLEEILRFLVENDDEYLLLKRKMICLKRVENKLPAIPQDDYLLGYTK